MLYKCNLFIMIILQAIIIILNNLIVMLELWGMRNAHSLPSLTGSLWPGMVTPDMVLSMCQIELNCVLILNWIAKNETVFAW